tara:strand:+ start:1006 stop:1413 length:408 start_codon:yes stop_codon:yes gene_type:complete
MAHTTYNLLKDPKLLLLATTHLNKAIESSISALLYHDFLFKRISRFPEDYSSKMDIFKRNTLNRYSLPRSVIPAIMEIREIVKDHQSSEMEFRRKNKFIIASKNFRLRALTIEKLKNLIKLTKPLINKVSEIKET